MDDGHPPAPTGTPAAEFAIDTALVTELLADQHPDLSRLPVQRIDSGWDNAMFRLGDHLAVRLPRRAAAADLIVNEQTWLPRLAPQLTIPVPVPLRAGTPARGYPCCWSIVPWLPGTTADQHEPASSQAKRLASFLRSLHSPAPADAPANPARGCPLSQRADSVEIRMQRLAKVTNLITPQIRHIWETAVNAPLDMPPTWLHGDLHPRNILVEQGTITGVIDWADITSGDPATDLASLWLLFADPRVRGDALSTYGNVSDSTRQRTKGWAVLFGVMLLDTGLVDHPRHAAIGKRILSRIISD